MANILTLVLFVFGLGKVVSVTAAYNVLLGSSASSELDDDRFGGVVRQKRQLQTVSSPLVTADCNNSTMFIEVHFHMAFNGIVFARGFRDTCSFEPSTSDDGSVQTRDMSIQIPLNNQRGRDTVFCGPRLRSNGEIVLALEVREHKVLETGKDRVFIVTCPAG